MRPLASSWEQRKLGDVATIVGGGTPSTNNDAYWDGDIDWYSPAELGEQVYADRSARRITQAGYDSCSATLLPAGKTILFTSRAGIGNTAILRRSACTNQGFQSLVMNDDIDVYFIYSMTDRIKKFAEQKASGSTFLEISGKGLAAGEFAFPSKDEQTAIGSMFKQLDHLITLHQRKYDKLCAVKKSMLDKIFPKPGEVEPEIRFAGFTDPWEQRKLSELTTMHARIGWQNLRTSEFFDSGNYYLITGTDFENGYVNLSTCHYVNKDRYDQDPNIQIDNGSILITKDGTLGKVALVQGLDKPATLNAGVFNVVIRNEEIVDNGYLYQYLKAPFLLNYVAQSATGGTIKHLNQNILVDFPVSMPSKGEQELIGDAFLRLDNLITLHQREPPHMMKEGKNANQYQRRIPFL